MGLTLTQIADNVNRHLRNNSATDLSNFSQADRNEVIKDAVRKYSRVRPIYSLEAVTGNNTGFYDLPTLWVDDFSTISEIEYPINESPPAILNEEYYCISLMSGGNKLRFKYNNPGLNNTFWVKFTIMHSFESDGSSAIPATDLDVISYLSASLMCQAFASFYASKANNALTDVEIVGYDTRVAEFRRLAGDFMKKYESDINDNDTGVIGNLNYLQDRFFNRDDD